MQIIKLSGAEYPLVLCYSCIMIVLTCFAAYIV